LSSAHQAADNTLGAEAKSFREVGEFLGNFLGQPLSLVGTSMSHRPKRIFEFGHYRLDAAERLLRRGDETIALQPKVFDLLLTLVERHGRLLEKDELMREVWPDAIVEETNLATNISILRKILGNGGDGRRFIETVPKRGYRFVAVVRDLRDDSVDPILEKRNGVIRAEGRAEGWAEGRGDEVVVTEGITTRDPADRPSRGKEARWRTSVTLLTSCLVVAGPIIAAIYLSESSRSKGPTPRPIEITRLISTGDASRATISPDGKYVAYLIKEAGRQSLRIRQIATGGDTQIAPPAEFDYLGMTFSPDSNYLYYVANDFSLKGGAPPTAALYGVAVIGGSSRKLIERLDSPITFSPDGNRIAFVREYTGQGESALMVARLDGTEERKLAVRKLPQYFDYPAWSPEGGIIACTAASYIPPNQLAFFDEQGRSLGSPAAARDWKHIRKIHWLKDGRELVLNVIDPERDVSQLWRVSYRDGEVRRITNDLNDYFDASLTADSSALVTVESKRFSSIWVAPVSNLSGLSQITEAGGAYDKVRWAPGGRIVYSTNMSGQEAIWTMKADGSDLKKMTPDGLCSLSPDSIGPSVSPDGRHIFFSCVTPGHRGDVGKRGICRMEKDGANIKTLTAGNSPDDPQCTPDGKWVVYAAPSPPKWSVLWKIPIDGGDAIQLNDAISAHPSISPDGRFIACFYLDDQTNTQTSQMSIAVLPFEGGPPSKIFKVSTAYRFAGIRWSADGRALTYVDGLDGHSNIWSQPLDGAPPKRLTDFKGDRAISFDWSPDGKRLVVLRGAAVSNVVSIANF
jgi:Tol biopolymer transport system component/DNA-binding winged helix-turn-helix (wHTH) protein